MRNGIGLLDRRPQRCASAVIPLSHMVIGTAFLEPLDIIWLDAASTVFVGVFLATAQSFANLVCCRNTHVPLAKSSIIVASEAVQRGCVVLSKHEGKE